MVVVAAMKTQHRMAVAWLFLNLFAPKAQLDKQQENVQYNLVHPNCVIAMFNLFLFANLIMSFAI